MKPGQGDIRSGAGKRGDSRCGASPRRPGSRDFCRETARKAGLWRVRSRALVSPGTGPYI